jgi:hypothetical protein
METPERCRQHAKELELKAASVRLRADRENLLAMARAWRARAETLEPKMPNEPLP